MTNLVDQFHTVNDWIFPSNYLTLLCSPQTPHTQKIVVHVTSVLFNILLLHHSSSPVFSSGFLLHYLPFFIVILLSLLQICQECHSHLQVQTPSGGSNYPRWKGRVTSTPPSSIPQHPPAPHHCSQGHTLLAHNSTTFPLTLPATLTSYSPTTHSLLIHHQ